MSHDQFFVNAVCDEAWVVNNGKVKRAASFLRTSSGRCASSSGSVFFAPRRRAPRCGAAFSNPCECLATRAQSVS